MNTDNDTPVVADLKQDDEFLIQLQEFIQAAQNGSYAEVSKKLTDLQNLIEGLRRRVAELPGSSEYDRAGQVEHIAALREQLAMKQALVAKYKDLGPEVLRH